MVCYSLDSRGPLETQEIRLLEIYPSAIANHELRCQLFRVTLDATQVHPYEALSYVWGDEMMRAEITCNEQLISITLNLFDALKKLRLPQKSRFIWADAICIDQSCALEKSCQIPLMRKIYSSAERVVVWLGNCDFAQAEEALKFVRLIANQLKKVKEEGESEYISEKEYETLQMPNDYTVESTHEFLRHLYARPWFSRIWCIQEIILGRDAVMLWGELELSWVDVGEIATWLSNVQPIRALEFEDDAFYADVEYSNATYMYAIRRKRLGLLDLLDYMRSFQSTNLRDKVYGILALVEPAEDAGALSVDYNKDVGEVYADVVIAEIQSYSTLDALAYVDHGAEYFSEGSLTSWTPQWNDQNGGLRRLGYDDWDLSACGDRMVELTDASYLNSQCLRLKGCFYDRITTVHTEIGIDNMQDHRGHPFKDIVITVFGQQIHDQGKNQPAEILCKLARTLTAGCNSEMKEITAINQEEKQNFYGSFLNYVDCLRKEINFLEFRKKQQPQESFYDEAEIVCSGRRFFQTEGGSFGIGPACMEKGDVVVVLFGGNTPYILRPCGRSYLFMGQAYVDELMNGQLVEAMEAGLLQEREFFLV